MLRLRVVSGRAVLYTVVRMAVSSSSLASTMSPPTMTCLGLRTLHSVATHDADRLACLTHRLLGTEIAVAQPFDELFHAVRLVGGRRKRLHAP